MHGWLGGVGPIASCDRREDDALSDQLRGLSTQCPLLDVLVDIAEHGLSSRTLEWSQEVTVTVVLVSRGYPGKIETGKEIVGLDEAKRIEGVKVYHAGTRWVDGKVYSAGGRVLNVTARGATLAEAVERAYFVTEMIEFDGKDYRKDIGRKGLLKQR